MRTSGSDDPPSGNPIPASADVLVVGYGPVGATIACLLGGYGVRTVVVDKAPDILMMPRAIGMDNEAQRTLQQAGLEDGAFPKLAVPVCRMHSPYTGEFAAFDTAGVIDGYAKLVTFYQPDLEHALRACAATFANVTCATGVELLGFAETHDGLHVRLQQSDGSIAETDVRYLVGADGASSMVRGLIGQDFRGRTYAEDWLIVDAKNVREPIDHIEFHCKPRGASPHLPAPGNRERWEFMLGPGETAEQMEQPDEIKRLLAPWGDPARMEIERKAVYRFHARCCDSFRKGRVFLAGDAAHVTPPFVGQGLVSGLRDAGNLCWKLAWVVRGHASPAVLESYDVERRPHARAMIDLARGLGQLIMPRNPVKARLLHGLMRGLRLIPPFRRYIDGMKMKPKLRYRDGLFVKGRGRLQRGTWLPQGLVRCPDGDTRLSDGALGDHLTLVGFAVDPRAHLDAAAIDEWRAIGGQIVQIAMRAQVRHRDAQAYEDLTGVLVPGAAPVGWAAVIRPDRIVLHDGPVTDAARLIRESRALLHPAVAADPSRTRLQPKSTQTAAPVAHVITEKEARCPS